MARSVFCVFVLILVANHGVEIAASIDGLGYLQSLPREQPYRTAYHFQPPKFWMNDPNGPMYFNGVYHLFYQHNPTAPLFSDGMIWAHSVSYDLVNWVHLDHVFLPTEPFDITSVWSGSATILPGNKPVILYTGIDSEQTQVQNMATPKNLSDLFLKEWVKYSGNPIITPPEGIAGDSFRDPSTAWLGHDGKWRVVIGSNDKNDKGITFLYKSEDFYNWVISDYPHYLSDQISGTWECVDFYPVAVNSKNGVDTSVVGHGIKHVMKVGFYLDHRDYYTIGNYLPEKDNYIPESGLNDNKFTLRYDYGKFYASKTFFDSLKGRRILWAWVNESDSKQDDIEKGWAGLQTIPRNVLLDKNKKQLVQWPVEEVEKLREKEVSFHGERLDGGSFLEIAGIMASQADVMVSFKLTNLEDAETMDPSWINPQLICSEKNSSSSGKFGPFGLLAFVSDDLQEQTAIFFRIFKDHGKFVVLMCSDQSRSSLRNGIDKTTYGAFVDINPEHEEISLRSLIDHSIVESFAAGGKTCITARVYPVLAIDENAHLYVFNNGAQTVEISMLSAWSMKKAQINAEDRSSDEWSKM